LSARKLGVRVDRLRVERGTVLAEDAWLEVSIDDTWLAAVRLVIQDGHVVVAEVRVFPRERAPGAGVAGLWSAEVLGNRASAPRGGITSRLLRKIPIGEYPAHVRSVIGPWHQIEGMPRESVTVGFPGVVVAERPRPERNTGRPDWFFAQLAADYVDAVASGSRRPVADLARRRRFPPARIRDMLHEARERGLLSRGERGRRGGYLLPRAMEILRQRGRAPR